ncbi:MAG: 5-(carboxyamino)imidazole ribonucleotide mutase [Burkholderiaceae bacterium]|jgi:5-(carboxyamino)imidazole ribonucleotide mutase|nr:5-(carboxyamino)imidazole ribonucleotide mutase [Burkholderiaceae bacterium]
MVGKVRKKKPDDAVKVGIVMGSTSDWEVMKEAAQMCEEFGIPYEARALSAHRSPAELEAWITRMEERGCQAFVAGAGGSAHLAGVVAAQTILPTFGVPMPSKYMKGLDSLLATVQMPKGIPVPTLAIGEAGAANATLAIVAVLALNDAGLKKKLLDFRVRQSEKVRNATLPELR